MAIDTTRQGGQLIKIETDRRLGHEWDEWDGTPLDNGGDFRAPARLYFGFTAVGFVLVAGAAGRGGLPPGPQAWGPVRGTAREPSTIV